MRVFTIATLMATSAFGGMLNVNIDTSAVAGSLLRVAFDITTSSPAAFSCFGNCLSILNFTAPGSTFQPADTAGGLVTGDLILLQNPAAFTYIDKGSPYNNVTVNLGSVGNTIGFTLSYTEAGPAGGNPPDQIALFLLDSNYLPLFPTSDPLGLDSLLTIDLTGASGGVVRAFSPARLSGSSVSLAVPNGSGPGDTVIPEPPGIIILTLGAAALVFASRSKSWKRRQS